jgi:hypothetical protein
MNKILLLLFFGISSSCQNSLPPDKAKLTVYWVDGVSNTNYAISSLDDSVMAALELQKITPLDINGDSIPRQNLIKVFYDLEKEYGPTIEGAAFAIVNGDMSVMKDFESDIPEEELYGNKDAEKHLRKKKVNPFHIHLHFDIEENLVFNTNKDFQKGEFTFINFFTIDYPSRKETFIFKIRYNDLTLANCKEAKAFLDDRKFKVIPKRTDLKIVYKDSTYVLSKLKPTSEDDLKNTVFEYFKGHVSFPKPPNHDSTDGFSWD